MQSKELETDGAPVHPPLLGGITKITGLDLLYCWQGKERWVAWGYALSEHYYRARWYVLKSFLCKDFGLKIPARRPDLMNGPHLRYLQPFSFISTCATRTSESLAREASLANYARWYNADLTEFSSF